MKNLFKNFAVCAVITTCATTASAQSFKAIISPEYDVYYSIDLKEFTLSIDTEGRPVGFEGAGTLPLKYDINGRVKQMGDKKVSYDYLDRLAGIGSITFSYDVSNRIVKVGEVEIGYDFLSKKISNIGVHDISYDFITKRITKIGSATINYDLNGRIEAVDDKDKIIMLRATGLAAN